MKRLRRNEDDEGNRHVLFPLPHGQTQNPLAPDREHYLPGVVWGEDLTWGFSEHGKVEKIFLVASLEPLEPLEEAVRKGTSEETLSYPRVEKELVSALRGMDIVVPRRKRAETSGESLERVIGDLVESSARKGKIWHKKFVLDKHGGTH